MKGNKWKLHTVLLIRLDYSVRANESATVELNHPLFKILCKSQASQHSIAKAILHQIHYIYKI